LDQTVAELLIRWLAMVSNQTFAQAVCRVDQRGQIEI
jgi:hypothetical protein